MPKSLYIDPEKTLHPKEHVIKIPDIPVMTYDKTVKQELKEGNFTEEDLLRIYRDMSYIREFETMLNLVKTTGGYNGVPYNNPGPAHLSAGQEAAAVGMAYTLDTDDFIFGSHRSHGEILAKGLRSIQILPDAELKKIMEEFWDGATLKVAKKAYSGNDVKELGIRFLLYGAMAEIFTHSSLLSEYIQTMPSWVVPEPLPSALLFIRRLTARKASWSLTWAMAQWAAAPCWKA